MENLKHIARLSAAALFLSMAPLHAGESDMSWIPEEIDMPEDMEIVTDRSIGSAIRVFTFTTAEDTDALADRWREALTIGPYQVQPPAEGMDQRLIEFSGGSIQNGQIAFMRGADGTDTTVTFDASLVD
ncbi:MAG: hypothetical protein ACNA7O_11890 [Rhodobacterales bacterium]